MDKNQLPICEKCGKPVPPENDAYLFDDLVAEVYPFSQPILTGMHRHLFPTATCEGSPSRAQYVPGQPKDSRPGAHYNTRDEQFYRTIYTKFVSKYGGYQP